MRRLLNILGTPTAKSSAVFYFGTFINNFGKYLFHLTLLRLLLPAEYGEFLTYLSLLYLLAIPNSAISTIVVKFVAQFRGRGDDKSINLFFYYILRKLSPLTTILGISMMIFSVPLSNIFKAHQSAFIILGTSVLISPLTTLATSYLLAFQRFSSQVIIGLVQITTMIILALVFIRMSFSATGAVAAQILSGVFATFLILILIRKAIFPLIKAKNTQFSVAKFSGYSLIYAVGSLSLISSDVLMVRSLFDQHLSGIYSSLSILGRMIYFGLGPIITLILPVAAHRHAATESPRSAFLKLGSVILGLGLVGTSVFVFFPQKVITMLSGSNYLEAAIYLPHVGITTLLFSLNLFMISYFMAVGRPEINKMLLLATISQPTLISLFHSSLSEVVLVNFIIELALFVTLFWKIRRLKI